LPNAEIFSLRTELIKLDVAARKHKRSGLQTRKLLAQINCKKKRFPSLIQLAALTSPAVLRKP